MTAYAQRAAWRSWTNAQQGTRPHHAWLLAGPRGLGKSAFATRAACDLLNLRDEQSHPDVIRLVPPPKDDKEARKAEEGKPFERKRNISVVQVRAMIGRLATRPTGDRRAIILDPADSLERGAANALLKVLEEPPRGTVFLLVSHHAARLLPTIRSRCRVLRFAGLDGEAMATALASERPEAGDREREAAAAAAARGAIGQALEFIDLGLADADRTMDAVTDGKARFGSLTETVGQRPDRERLGAMIALARKTVARNGISLDGAGAGRCAVAYHALARLGTEAKELNYDPALLTAELERLLASVAHPNARSDG